VKITIHIGEDEVRDGSLKFPTAERVDVDGSCPLCKHEPFQVSGKNGTTEQSRDSITQDAVCRACDEVVGKVKVTFDTIFGIEEDERVLGGPHKVF